MAEQSKQTWLRVTIDSSLKEDFKSLCWAQNISLTDKISELLYGEIVRHRKEVEEARMLRARSSRNISSTALEQMKMPDFSTDVPQP